MKLQTLTFRSMAAHEGVATQPNRSTMRTRCWCLHSFKVSAEICTPKPLTTLLVPSLHCPCVSFSALNSHFIENSTEGIRIQATLVPTTTVLAWYFGIEYEHSAAGTTAASVTWKISTIGATPLLIRTLTLLRSVVQLACGWKRFADGATLANNSLLCLIQ